MQTKIILVSVFSIIIISTLGAPHQNKDFIPEVYQTSTSSRDHVEQNVNVDPSNGFAAQHALRQPILSVNPQADDQTQPVLHNQPTNPQAIFLSNQQNQQPILLQKNPNQQTILLTNLQPQPILMTQPNQNSVINQLGNQGTPQILYIQHPSDQQGIWLSSAVNQQPDPNEVIINQPYYQKSNNQPIILIAQPNQQPITSNQQPTKQVSPSEAINGQSNQQPNQQQLFIISPQTNQQLIQQGTNQIKNPILIDQSAPLHTIWIASQPNHPAILVNQQTNLPTSNQLGQPMMVNVVQPAFASSGIQPMFGKPNEGNIVIIPTKEQTSPNE